MSVSSISSGIDPYQSYMTGMQDGIKQRRQDFQALAQSLNNGDLAGAQKAFAALQQDMQSLQGTQSTQSTQTSLQSGQTTDPLSQISTDFQNLSQALSSGDLSGSQQALATLQQDMQAAGVSMMAGKHHHHHHHVAGVDNTQNGTQTDDSQTSLLSPVTDTSGSSTGTGSQSTGANINVTV